MLQRYFFFLNQQNFRPKVIARNDTYNNGDRWIEYDDGKKNLSLSFDFRNNRFNGGLLYCYKHILDMKTQNDKSEL